MSPAYYKSKQIYLFFITCLLLTACKHGKKVDVSDIKLSVKIERFDRDFDQMNSKSMLQQSILMKQQYGPFYQDFMERILRAGSIRDTAYFKTLHAVFASRDYNSLKEEVNTVFPNLDQQEEQLTDAFKRIKYYYPKKQLPKIYAYFSGFQAQTSIGDRYFAIGLDMFLGEHSKFYPALIENFPHYVSRRFTPDNIAPRVVDGIAREDMFVENDNNKSLLDKMIYNGKILYFMDQILPDVADSTKIGYTNAQMKWCADFKPQIWGYFLEENLLFQTDYTKIRKYLEEAPFTTGLGEKNESAPRLAIWTGWQIVREYMDKNPKVTLQQLMVNQDAQAILNGSGYHPK